MLCADILSLALQRWRSWISGMDWWQKCLDVRYNFSQLMHSRLVACDGSCFLLSSCELIRDFALIKSSTMLNKHTLLIFVCVHFMANSSHYEVRKCREWRKLYLKTTNKHHRFGILFNIINRFQGSKVLAKNVEWEYW